MKCVPAVARLLCGSAWPCMGPFQLYFAQNEVDLCTWMGDWLSNLHMAIAMGKEPFMHLVTLRWTHLMPRDREGPLAVSAELNVEWSASPQFIRLQLRLEKMNLGWRNHVTVQLLLPAAARRRRHHSSHESRDAWSHLDQEKFFGCGCSCRESERGWFCFCLWRSTSIIRSMDHNRTPSFLLPHLEDAFRGPISMATKVIGIHWVILESDLISEATTEATVMAVGGNNLWIMK